MEGGVAIAVSLDIANAFNTLLWDAVGDALLHYGVPRYLVEVTRQYFRDRSLEFVTDSRADGKSDAGFHRDRYLAPYYGTSRTIGYFTFLSPAAVTSSVTQTTH